HAMSPLVKIAWMKLHDPSTFKAARRFISLKEYVVHQMTANYVVDYSIASATGFFNVKDLKWESMAFDYAGVNGSYFSEAVPIYFSDFTLKTAIQKSLKLDSKVKLIIGSSDGCLATLSTGSITKN